MHMCGENDEVRILIRRCDCGKYEDAKHLLHDGKDLSPEGFGESIEMHISDECEYSQLILPNGTIRLEKYCYCARELRMKSALHYRDLNDPSDIWHNKRSRRERKEHHDSGSCKYIKTTWYIHGRIANNDFGICPQNEVIVLIRRCKCEQYKDKTHLDGKDLSPEEFRGGIEMHISDKCGYSKVKLPNGKFQLEKRCYCARE